MLWGDTAQQDVWDDLTEYLSQTWVSETGAVLPVYSTAIDSGGTKGMTTACYEYCRGKAASRIFAVKGVGGWGRPLVGQRSHKKTGRNVRRVDLWPVGVDEGKLIVMRRLAVKEPGPGYCHFPDTRTPDYFSQLSAERLLTRYRKGHPVREWHKVRDRNEALDCRVYAMAALKIVNPSIKKAVDHVMSFEEEQEEVPDTPQVEPPEEQPDTAKRRKKRRRKGGGYLGRW